jgi:hypothetical protein
VPGSSSAAKTSCLPGISLAEVLRCSLREPDTRAEVLEAAGSFMWVARNRPVVGEPLAGELRLLDQQSGA